MLQEEFSTEFAVGKESENEVSAWEVSRVELTTFKEHPRGLDDRDSLWTTT